MFFQYLKEIVSPFDFCNIFTGINNLIGYCKIYIQIFFMVNYYIEVVNQVDIITRKINRNGRLEYNL